LKKAKSWDFFFFKSTVIKVLPGIQTSFVDIGKEKACFLHISEIDRELAIRKMSSSMVLDDEEARAVGRNKLAEAVQVKSTAHPN